MKKNIFLIIIFIVIHISIPSSILALNTTETYAVGPFTNFESYFTLNFSPVGKNYSWEFLTGGGFVQNCSYFVSTSIAFDSSSSEITYVDLGIIGTVIDIEKFSMDLIPVFAIDASNTSGELSYPDFKAFTGSLNLEFNLTMLRVFQPFITAGYNASYNDKSKYFSWQIPLAIGAVVPLKEGIEFLFEFGWMPTTENPRKGFEKTIAAGLNGMITKNLEIINELKWEAESRQLSILVGLIYGI